MWRRPRVYWSGGWWFRAAAFYTPAARLRAVEVVPTIRRLMPTDKGEMVERVDCVVAGAGVVGLAVARAMALAGKEVLVLEAQPMIGSEVSSRNSGVIHAGIYYPKDSVKAEVCVAGKHLLYDFCAEHGVAHARIGKLIVATEEDQLEGLEQLKIKAADNGVADLEHLSPTRAAQLEPEVACVGALFSPSTGIIDVHEYMLALQGEAEANGAYVALNSPCRGGRLVDDGIVLQVAGQEVFEIKCEQFVNSAALGAQPLAQSIDGFPPAHIPPLHYAKGNYFSLLGKNPFRHLVYPMPSGTWLGVHVTVDLGGRCRFGPDFHWLDEIDYDVDPREADSFYASIRRYYPALQAGALQPDYSGIRPKVTGPGETALDFIIQGPGEHGVPGMVNLFGIESPGLTSSLAIADKVAAVLSA